MKEKFISLMMKILADDQFGVLTDWLHYCNTFRYTISSNQIHSHKNSTQTNKSLKT
jgi:hypothetical protein